MTTFAMTDRLSGSATFCITLMAASLVAGSLPAQQVVELEVVSSDAMIRRHANRLAEPVQHLREKEIVAARPGERQGDYIRVQLPDGEGWIHESYVRPPAVSLGMDGAAADVDRNAALAGEGTSDGSSRAHLSIGRPESVLVRTREGYVVGLDARLRIPAWVQYELKASELSGPGDRDRSDFEPDSSLPLPARSSLGDYRGSGFDRGHMAPAADMKRSQQVMDESFLLSNIAPQVGLGFNRDIWALLETAIRGWTRDRGTLTVITGPIFEAEDGTVAYAVVGENEVAVPNAFYKIVVDVDRGETLAFAMPHEPLFGRELDEFLVSIDSLEARTGLDFLAELPDSDEERLESTPATEVWETGDELRLLAARIAEDVRLFTIEFGERGEFVDPSRLEALAAEARRIDPTHIFLLAHGWNNSQRDALNAYRSLLAVMGETADRNPGLRPTEYRPLVVGVYWPSKAWDESDGARRLRDSGVAGEIIDVLPPGESAEVYRQDVLTLRELLSRPDSEITDADRAAAWEIFNRYSSEPKTAEDESVFDAPADERLMAARGTAMGRVSIRDLFRVFTFWQMKKRAGTVGGEGGRRLIARLMQAAPEASVHLGGHSFGAKFWLAAVASDRVPLPRPVKSLALVQGAVSAYAFAERVPGTDRSGGYRVVLSRVDGPVIATWSTHDLPLNYAYPLGSRLVGQTGELERDAQREPSRYAALGAVGAAGAGRRVAFQAALAGPPESDLWSIDGRTVIGGHSEIYNDAVARLLWATINSGKRD